MTEYSLSDVLERMYQNQLALEAALMELTLQVEAHPAAQPTPFNIGRAAPIRPRKARAWCALKLGGHHRPKRRHQKECLPDAYNELPPKVSYLQKPWAIDSLVSAITELLHQESPVRPSR